MNLYQLILVYTEKEVLAWVIKKVVFDIQAYFIVLYLTPSSSE